jgi:hypothetical protein
MRRDWSSLIGDFIQKVRAKFVEFIIRCMVRRPRQRSHNPTPLVGGISAYLFLGRV